MASPLKIMIGLHYWTSPTDYSADDLIHQQCEVVRDALADFVNGGLLQKLDTPNRYGGRYKATDALGVWVDSLCRVRWPVQVWVVPKDSGLSCACLQPGGDPLGNCEDCDPPSALVGGPTK